MSNKRETDTLGALMIEREAEKINPATIRMGGNMKPGEIWIVRATKAGYGMLLSRISPETKRSFWRRLKFEGRP